MQLIEEREKLRRKYSTKTNDGGSDLEGDLAEIKNVASPPKIPSMN